MSFILIFKAIYHLSYKRSSNTNGSLTFIWDMQNILYVCKIGETLTNKPDLILSHLTNAVNIHRIFYGDQSISILVDNYLIMRSDGKIYS